MKILNMTAKTALEISDDDIFVIEDNQATKKVTASELRKYIFRDNYVQEVINETLDKVANAILDSKYILIKEHEYLMNTWIGSASGNVQITLKDLEQDKWLTENELLELLVLTSGDYINTDEYVIEVSINGILHTAASYTLKDFNAEHPNAQTVNEALFLDNAGFIKAHFDNLTQNEISGIKYNDVFVSLNDRDFGKERFVFTQDANSFANSVPFIGGI